MDTYPSDREAYPARKLDKTMAAIEGAAEGVADGIERHGLADAAHRAIDQADQLRDRVGRSFRPNADRRPSAVARKLHEATGRATAMAHDASESVRRTTQDIRYKSRAIAETGRRARAAPPIVAQDLRKAAGAWAGGLAAGAGWYAALGVCAIFGLVLLTMAAVGALAPAIGAPLALLVVGCVYAAAAFACLGAARTAQARANEEARKHMAKARDDVRRVTQPVREAFAPQPVAQPAIQKNATVWARP